MSHSPEPPLTTTEQKLLYISLIERLYFYDEYAKNDRIKGIPKYKYQTQQAIQKLVEQEKKVSKHYARKY